jgi:holo-[acyl-carrier protein] synthase
MRSPAAWPTWSAPSADAPPISAPAPPPAAPHGSISMITETFWQVCTKTSVIMEIEPTATSRRVAGAGPGSAASSWQAESVIAGIGVDIVAIPRLDAALRRTPGLAERLFTVAERTWAAGRRAPADTLAGSFTAKEALAKVLGAPVGLHWTDAEVLRDDAGRPFLTVRGTVEAAARAHGIGSWHLSISHDGGMCIAMVVAESAPATGITT